MKNDDQRELEAACRGVLEAADGEARAHEDLSRALYIAFGHCFFRRPRAQAILREVFGHQRADGSIPRHPGQGPLISPLAGTIVRRIFFLLCRMDSAAILQLEPVVAGLDRFFEHLHDGSDGKLRWSAPADERVLPGQPADRGGGAGRILDVGTNAAIVQAESDLIDLAIACERPAQEILVRRTRRAAALRKQTWNADREIFQSRSSSGWIGPESLEGALPLFAGVALPPQARAIMARHLEVPGEGFWGAYPLSTIPRDHGSFAPDRPGGGAVSPLLNYLMMTGLHRYGYPELSRQLRDATMSLARERGLFDAYHAVTGEGIGPAGSPRTAALVLSLIHAPEQLHELCSF